MPTGGRRAGTWRAATGGRARHGRDGLAAHPVDPGQQLGHDGRGRAGRRVCSARAHSAATSCGCGTRPSRELLVGAFGAVGRRGDEQPAQSTARRGTGRERSRARGRRRPAAAPPDGGQLLGGAAVTSTRRPSPTSAATASATASGVWSWRISSGETRIAAPMVAASSGGLRGAGVSASVAANASARWRTPRRDCGGRDHAADLLPGLRRGLVGARGGEAVDEYGEIGGPVGGSVCPGPAVDCSTSDADALPAATVTSRFALDPQERLTPIRVNSADAAEPTGHLWCWSRSSVERGQGHARRNPLSAAWTGPSGTRRRPAPSVGCGLNGFSRRALVTRWAATGAQLLGALVGVVVVRAGWRRTPSAALAGPSASVASAATTRLTASATGRRRSSSGGRRSSRTRACSGNAEPPKCACRGRVGDVVEHPDARPMPTTQPAIRPPRWNQRV